MKVGDKVQATELCVSSYPLWDVVGKVGTVTRVHQDQIFDHALSAVDRVKFVAKFGKQQVYNPLELLVEINDGTYIVSDFHFELIPSVSKKKKVSKEK